MFNFSSSYAMHQKKFLMEQEARRKKEKRRPALAQESPIIRKEVVLDKLPSLQKIKQTEHIQLRNTSQFETPVDNTRIKVGLSMNPSLTMDFGPKVVPHEPSEDPLLKLQHSIATQISKKESESLSQLSTLLHSLGTQVEKQTFIVNELKDKGFANSVQLKSLLENVNTLQSQIKKFESFTERKTIAQNMTAFGIAKQKIQLCESVDGKMTDEFVEVNERTMLVYPTVVDQHGNVWIGIRRIFDNGALVDHFGIFFKQQTQEFTFESFEL